MVDLSVSHCSFYTPHTSLARVLTCLAHAHASVGGWESEDRCGGYGCWNVAWYAIVLQFKGVVIF